MAQSKKAPVVDDAGHTIPSGTKTYPAQIEVDEQRGVVYVHLTRAKDIDEMGTPTAIRIKFVKHTSPILPTDRILLHNRSIEHREIIKELASNT